MCTDGSWQETDFTLSEKQVTDQAEKEGQTKYCATRLESETSV